MAEKRPCPVCGASEATLFLDENIDPSKISAFSYASRKTPEYMRHRMVRCEVCDLVYVDAPPAQEALAEAYHVAEYDSAEEADDAARCYVRALQPVLDKLPARGRALEIGAGTGVLLEGLKAQGFEQLVGVEPSTAAIAAAPPHRRPWLMEGIFRESQFEPGSFDLICCFMTMEHVRDPMATAMLARTLLRPGGAFVTVTHDYRSLVNRLMHPRSPIIDIEHMQLFSSRSIRELFARSGFSDVAARSFYNRYSLKYWMRLAPLPPALKGPVSTFARLTGIERLRLSANVGNTMAVGFARSAG